MTLVFCYYTYELCVFVWWNDFDIGNSFDECVIGQNAYRVSGCIRPYRVQNDTTHSHNKEEEISFALSFVF